MANRAIFRNLPPLFAALSRFFVKNDLLGIDPLFCLRQLDDIALQKNEIRKSEHQFLTRCAPFCVHLCQLA